MLLECLKTRFNWDLNQLKPKLIRIKMKLMFGKSKKK